MLPIVREWRRRGRSAQWAVRPLGASTVVLHLASEMADLTTDPTWAAHRPALASAHGRGADVPLVWVRPYSNALPVAASDLVWLEQEARAYGVRALLGDRDALGAPAGWQPYGTDEATLWVYPTAIGRACEDLPTRLAYAWLGAALEWQLAVRSSATAPFYLVVDVGMRARCRRDDGGAVVAVDECHVLVPADLMPAWRALAADTRTRVRFDASDMDAVRDPALLMEDPTDAAYLLFVPVPETAVAGEKQTERASDASDRDARRFDRASGRPPRWPSEPVWDALLALRASRRAGEERVVVVNKRTGTTLLLVRTETGGIRVRARVLASDQPALRQAQAEETTAVRALFANAAETLGISIDPTGLGQ